MAGGGAALGFPTVVPCGDGDARRYGKCYSDDGDQADPAIRPDMEWAAKDFGAAPVDHTYQAPVLIHGELRKGVASMNLRKFMAGAAISGPLGFIAIGLGAGVANADPASPVVAGFRGSKIEAMGAMGAIGAMATVQTGATMEAGDTVETGATGDRGAASAVRLGTSPGARSRGSCGR